MSTGERVALQELAENRLEVPGCGSCEDGWHGECSHPKGTIDLPDGSTADVCCCTQNPLAVGVLDLLGENERLRRALRVLLPIAEDHVGEPGNDGRSNG